MVGLPFGRLNRWFDASKIAYADALEKMEIIENGAWLREADDNAHINSRAECCRQGTQPCYEVELVGYCNNDRFCGKISRISRQRRKEQTYEGVRSFQNACEENAFYTFGDTRSVQCAMECVPRSQYQE